MASCSVSGTKIALFCPHFWAWSREGEEGGNGSHDLQSWVWTGGAGTVLGNNHVPTIMLQGAPPRPKCERADPLPSPPHISMHSGFDYNIRYFILVLCLVF